MLGEALSFPRRGDDWLKTTLIGGVLWILGAFLLIPLLPVQGLFIRALRAGVVEEPEPPVFEDWGDLFVDGILMLVIQLAYTIVPAILFAVGGFTLGAGAFAAEGGAGNAGAGIGIVGGLILFVAFLLMLLVSYVIPAALANFAYEDEFGAAFDLSTIRRAAFTGDYFVAVVLAIVVGVVLGTVAALLSVLLVGIFLMFYVQMSIYYLFGRGFGKALDVESVGGTGGTDDENRGRDDSDIPDPDPLT